jgi:YHS domain-containing protein
MTRTIVLLIAALAFVTLVAGCGQKEEQSQVEETAEEVQVASAKVIDPVCGMSIDAEAAVTAEHEGETYHFCSIHCKEKFMEDPEKHMSEAHKHMEGEEKPHMEEEGHEGHGH